MNRDEAAPTMVPAEPETAVEISDSALDAAVGGAANVAKPVAPRGAPRPPSIAGDVFEGTGI